MPLMLPYAPVPSASRSVARLVRMLLATAAVACVGIGIVALFRGLPIRQEDMPAMYGTPLAPANFGDKSVAYAIESETVYYLWVAVLLALFFLGQWLFLL